MEKVGYFVDNEQDHADAQTADGQNANDGQTSLGTVEDGQHGGDHTHEPGTDGGQNRQDRFSYTGDSTGHEHKAIKKHRNTTFQKILLCTVWPQPEHLTKRRAKTRIKGRLESL